MAPDSRPVLVAYDGSAAAQAAVRTAAALFADRTLLVVSVWEPGLAAMAMAPGLDQVGATYTPDVADSAALDRAQRDHAAEVADAGVELARELGATSEPLAVRDEADVVETIIAVAEQRDACAVVVGSRGLGGIKARLMGSTSQALLHHTRRPVLVVRDPQ